MAELTKAPLRVSVVSADQELWSGEAKQVVAKTLIGELGILRGHEPVLAILAPGEVRITLDDGSVVKVKAEDGFFSFENDNVTVVSRDAVLVQG